MFWHDDFDELTERLGQARAYAEKLGERGKLLCYLLDMASLEASELMAERLDNEQECPT